MRGKSFSAEGGERPYLLGTAREERLGRAVWFAALTKSSTLVDSINAQPRWLVVAGVIVAVAVASWLIAKLLKWALMGLLVAVLVGGVALAAWLLLKS